MTPNTSRIVRIFRGTGIPAASILGNQYDMAVFLYGSSQGQFNAAASRTWRLSNADVATVVELCALLALNTLGSRLN
jgi:hypothetical protein